MLKRRKTLLVAAAVFITARDVFKGVMAMQPSSKLLEKIEEIADGRAPSSARLGKQLAMTLEPDPARSSEFMLKYTGHAGNDGMFRSVALRVPGPAASTPSSLVILDINPAICVTMAEVRLRYGIEGDISIPAPQQSADSLWYLVYSKSWGDISFGYARDDTKCLRRVIINTTTPLP